MSPAIGLRPPTVSPPVRWLATLCLSTVALLWLAQPERTADAADALVRAVERAVALAHDPRDDGPALRRAGPWGASIDAFVAEDRAHPPVPGGVVVVGGSSVRLWNLDRAFPSSGIVLRGFGGSQLEDSVRYARTLILPHRPRSVVVYAGENDLAVGASPQRVFERYLAFVQQVHAVLPETRIVFVSMKPSPSRLAILPAMREANARIAAHARTDPRLVFVDVHGPMLDARGAPRRELFQPDMLHLNDAGYALWNAALAPLLR